MRVGITGQDGFIGTNLFNSLNTAKNIFETIPFEDAFFLDHNSLETWVTKCDVIVHLAAMSRHADSKVLYNTNINLANKIIAAIDKTNSKPHIIYTSSIQEECDTEYGKSKKESRLMFKNWSEKKKCSLYRIYIT